jgi:hypothetical protein
MRIWWSCSVRGLTGSSSSSGKLYGCSSGGCRAKRQHTSAGNLDEGNMTAAAVEGVVCMQLWQLLRNAATNKGRQLRWRQQTAAAAVADATQGTCSRETAQTGQSSTMVRSDTNAAKAQATAAKAARTSSFLLWPMAHRFSSGVFLMGSTTLYGSRSMVS